MSRPPLEEKPFVYVPVPKKEPDRRKFMSHEVQRGLTGRIDFDLEVVSDYLFIGSGGYDYDTHENKVFYSFFRTNDKLIIPGTSLKGSIRAVAEAISNSCVSQWTGRDSNFIPDTHKRCKSEDKLCSTCRIFGMTGYGGRIDFSDARPLTNITPVILKIGELFQPRVIKVEEQGRSKRKFYGNWQFNPIKDQKPERNHRFVEALNKGTHFRFSLSLNNLLDEELSLILHAMGVNQDYMIKVGGAKPRCFGTVRFCPLKGNLYTNPLENPTEISTESIKDYMKNMNLISPDLLKSLSEELRPREDKTCPAGNY